MDKRWLGLPRLEQVLLLLLGVSLAIVLALQLSSLYITPIHNSIIWWGDESWLMSEYKEQVASGVFRHPDAFASVIEVGNPFPFTAMWLSSIVYGGPAGFFASLNSVDVGRTITMLIALALLVLLTQQHKRLSIKSILIGVALLISCRCFLVTSHSARYDMFSALWILAVMLYIDRKQSLKERECMIAGVAYGLGLLVSSHVAVILALPIAFHLSTREFSLKKCLVFAGSAGFVVALLYVIHIVTQPSIDGLHSITHNVGSQPILHPLSWLVQRHNLLHKFNLLKDWGWPVFLMLIVISAGVLLPKAAFRKRMIFWILPVAGWMFLEAPGPVSYLIYMLPPLAFATIIAVHHLPRIAVYVATVGALIVLYAAGIDAISARKVGSVLRAEMQQAIPKIRTALGAGPIISMNASLSSLQSDPNLVGREVYSTHFVELPLVRNAVERLPGNLLLNISSSIPGFSWEALPLRGEIVNPALTLHGRFLDVNRSYFEPLDSSQDTIFLQHLDLDTFIQHYRR